LAFALSPFPFGLNSSHLLAIKSLESLDWPDSLAYKDAIEDGFLEAPYSSQKQMLKIWQQSTTIKASICWLLMIQRRKIMTLARLMM